LLQHGGFTVDDVVDDAVTGELPGWAEATGQRIAFLLRRRGGARAEVDAVFTRLRRSDPDEALRRYLHACLDLLADAVAAHRETTVTREDIAGLCAMARAAIAGDCDDRALNARARPLAAHSGVAGFAALVPGRVVWLAAMAAQMPDEEGAAATMLVNDLAAVDAGLPLRALRAAAGGA
jgi:hypothetical protein